MEILKYNKTKDNTYEIHLDDGNTLILYDETIIRFGLLMNKVLDNKKLSEITSFNDDLEAYYASLRHINKKMRSELEIDKYLSKKEFSSKTISNTIKMLKEKGYLDNNRYITSYINDQIKLTNNGPEKIKFNLIKLGFNESEIDINFDFNEKIEKLINKKVNMNHKKNTFTLKQDIANYLINLGYSKDSFIDILDNIKVDDSLLVKKEYDSLVKKYSKKYDDKKLKLFIKDKLYKKGYNIEVINEVISDGDVY